MADAHKPGDFVGIHYLSTDVRQFGYIQSTRRKSRYYVLRAAIYGSLRSTWESPLQHNMDWDVASCVIYRAVWTVLGPVAIRMSSIAPTPGFE